MPTRAELIQTKIDELKTELGKLNLQGYDAFINSNDYDLCDIVYLLSMTFHPVNDKNEIENIIVRGLISKGLEIHLRGVEEIRDFIIWFKKLE